MAVVLVVAVVAVVARAVVVLDALAGNPVAVVIAMVVVGADAAVDALLVPSAQPMAGASWR